MVQISTSVSMSLPVSVWRAVSVTTLLGAMNVFVTLDTSSVETLAYVRI